MWLAENRSPWGKSSEVIEMVEMVPVSVILDSVHTIEKIGYTAILTA